MGSSFLPHSQKTALLKIQRKLVYQEQLKKPSSLVEVNRLLLLCPPYYRKLKLSVKHGLIINPARCSDALLGASLWQLPNSIGRVSFEVLGRIKYNSHPVLHNSLEL